MFYVARNLDSNHHMPVGTPALYLGQASEPNLASFARLSCAYAAMPGLKRQIGMLGFLYLQHGASQQKRVALKIRFSKAFMLAVQNRPLL